MEVYLFMAKKGQKFNKFDMNLKKEVLEKFKSGMYSRNQLSEEYGIPSGTISNWIYLPEKSLSIAKRGRPKNDEIDYKARYEILKKYQAFLKEQQEKK